MENNTSQQTTFWKYLQEHEIEIPIIQRDYAQGRVGKEELRKSFLSNLKEALDENLANKEKVLKLDFVYGSDIHGKMNPLDGQQRLTTLWLLHWYIALKAGTLADNKETFKRFSYETRVSSREFIERLCEYKNNPQIGSLITDIQNQTWFYFAWKQDPTIQSMLLMLSGTQKTDKKDDNDIIDGIEKLFKETTEKEFNDYWEKLTEINKLCPIVFYSLDLNNLKLTDDLYIKMNARGEQLTSFENFKADLVGYINNQKYEEDEEYRKDPTRKISHKMDTSWTDIFWKNKSVDGKIDDIYFTFLNRFFLNALIIKKETEGDAGIKYSVVAEKIEYNESYKYLYGNSGDDSKNTYKSFDAYKAMLSDGILISLQKTLDNFSTFLKNKNLAEIQKLFYPSWEKESKFRFIPEYTKETTQSITTLTESQRIVFFAICKYFENNNECNETSLKRWMRVVWNIVENNATNFIGCMRLIDELSKHSHGIYEFLRGDSSITSNANADQIAEEREKANKILNGEGKHWEDVIIEAEKYAFFKGAIRFLFKDAEGNWNWDNFDKKFENAKNYFGEEGVRDKDKQYKTKVILLRSVLYYVNDFWGKIQPKKFVLDNTKDTWKYNILLASGWENAVNQILIGNLLEDIQEVVVRESDCQIYKDLYSTSLLEHIANEQIGSRIICIHGHRAIYPPNREGILPDDDCFDPKYTRNSILSYFFNESIITSDQKIDGCNFFKGWDIKFKYKKIEFVWNTDDHIYLCNDWGHKISVKNITNKNELLPKLDKLIFQTSSE